jgi:hypothetical protein
MFCLLCVRRAAPRAASAVVKVRAKLWSGRSSGGPGFIYRGWATIKLYWAFIECSRALGGAGGQEISECLHLSLLLLQWIKPRQDRWPPRGIYDSFSFGIAPLPPEVFFLPCQNLMHASLQPASSVEVRRNNHFFKFGKPQHKKRRI